MTPVERIANIRKRLDEAINLASTLKQRATPPQLPIEGWHVSYRRKGEENWTRMSASAYPGGMHQAWLAWNLMGKHSSEDYEWSISYYDAAGRALKRIDPHTLSHEYFQKLYDDKPESQKQKF